VIVTGTRGMSSSTVETAVDDTRKSTPGNGVGVKRKFASISGTSAQLTGKQILKLAGKSGVEAIVLDSEVSLTAYSNNQIWPQSAGTTTYGWATPPSGTSFPTIAIVDSGVSSRAAFGSRLIGSVDLNTSSGSGAFGHGTFVASIAAGGDSAYGGAEPHANVFSVKVLDGAGVGYKSDAIAAADWILRNKGTYNIRVANFSINTAGDSILYDPLDQAVENLWLNGVVVVVAAGNYAVNGQRSDVGFAPANDPYVITVGASDTNGTSSRSDDFAGPWSA
jgi:serine protease AprX